MLNFLDTSKFRLLQKNLDVAWQRINVTGENISNIDTPNYKAKRVEFENILRNKLTASERLYSEKLRQRVLPSSLNNVINSVNPTVYTDPSTQTRVDGNNVDIDHENIELARAKIQYDYLVRKISDEYNLLKYAITEGRG